jgi:hypothetical protein
MSHRKTKKVSYKEERDEEDFEMSEVSEENDFEDIERKRITEAGRKKEN